MGGLKGVEGGGGEEDEEEEERSVSIKNHDSVLFFFHFDRPTSKVRTYEM